MQRPATTSHATVAMDSSELSVTTPTVLLSLAKMMQSACLTAMCQLVSATMATKVATVRRTLTIASQIHAAITDHVLISSADMSVTAVALDFTGQIVTSILTNVSLRISRAVVRARASTPRDHTSEFKKFIDDNFDNLINILMINFYLQMPLQ